MYQLLSAYNEYPDITKEFTSPKHFVITRVHCSKLSLIVHQWQGAQVDYERT